MANRRSRANRNRDNDDDDRRYYGTGSASSGTQPGDRAAAAARQDDRAAANRDEKEGANPFGRRRPNKMSAEYGPPPPKQGPAPPPYIPLPPPQGVDIVNRLTTPLLRVVIDVDLILPSLFPAHLSEHPTLTECDDVY
eukprot:2551683-Amphidinium_carterae.1